MLTSLGFATPSIVRDLIFLLNRLIGPVNAAIDGIMSRLIEIHVEHRGNLGTA